LEPLNSHFGKSALLGAAFSAEGARRQRTHVAFIFLLSHPLTVGPYAAARRIGSPKMNACFPSLDAVTRPKLQRQVQEILAAAGWPTASDEFENLARTILHHPHMKSYLLSWRYLLAMEIRTMSPAARRLH
jgi:hypothetical protein